MSIRRDYAEGYYDKKIAEAMHNKDATEFDWYMALKQTAKDNWKFWDTQKLGQRKIPWG